MASEHDDDLLDIISDAIDESMDVDWTSRDGARHVLGALQIGGYIRTAAMDALIADSANLIDAPASADALGEALDQPLYSQRQRLKELGYDSFREAIAALEALAATPPPAGADALVEVERVMEAMQTADGSCYARGIYRDSRRYWEDVASAALSAMSPAGEVERIVTWLRSRADDIAPPETEGSDPLWTVHAFVHGMANQIECGDYRHD